MKIFNRNATSKVHKSVRLVRDSANAPKVSLDKVRAAGVSLSKSAESASKSLAARGLLGIRGKSILVLDYSGSMAYDYQSGAVQALTERALAFGLQFATDESVTVIPFASGVLPPFPVGLDNYQGAIERELVHRSMGSTNLTDALGVVRDIAKKSDELVYCSVVTDGNPDNRSTASDIVCELAGYPVFLKFLALRDVPYLQELDDLGDDKRLLDNVDAKFFLSLSAITDDQFAEAMSDEWDSWISLAESAGVLTN